MSSEVMSVLAKLDGDSRGMVTATDQGAKGMADLANKADKSAKDAEGSFGRMEGGVGKILGRVAGLVAGAFTIGAIVSWGKETVASLANIEAISAQTASAITATGGAAGVTADHVKALSDSLEAATATESESIQTGANLLLTFKNIQNGVGAGNDIFDQTTAVMTDMARAMGTDASGSAIQLGKALNDPVAGISALSRVGVTFTDDQKAMIQSLVDAGDVMGAQKIILAELNSEFGGSGAAYADTYAGKIDTLKNAFGQFSENLLSGAMPLLKELATVGATAFNWLANTDFVTNFGTNVVAAFTAISAAVGPALSTLGPLVADAFGQLAATVGPIVSQLVTAVGPAFTGLAQTVIPLLSQLSPLNLILTALAPVFPQIAAVVGQLAATLAGGLANVLPVIADVAGQLATVLSGVLAAALPPIISIVTTLAGVFQQLMPVIGTLAGTLGGVLVTAVTAVAPVISAILPIVASLAQTIGGILVTALTAGAGLFNTLLPIIGQLLAALMPIIPPILGIVEAFLPLIDVAGTLIGAILPPLVQLLMAVLGPIMSLISPILDLLTPAIQFLSDGLSTLIGWITNGIKWLVDLATGGEKSGKQLGDIFNWLFKNAIEPATKGIGSAIQWVQNVIGVAAGIIGGIVGGIGNTFSSVFGAIGGFISDAFNGALDVVRGAINGIIGLVNGAIGALNGLSITIPDFIPGIGGQTWGVSLPSIPYLARGGDVQVPGLSWVGENGPELLYMPQGAQVTPLGRAGSSSSTAGLGGGSTEYHWHNSYNLPPVDPAEIVKFANMQEKWQMEAAGVTV